MSCSFCILHSRETAAVVLCCFIALAAFAGPNLTDEELRREASMADFAARTRAANYPALFDQAAKEFRVPSDVLKAIAFAETRWEHLTWPPGELASPDTGMPRPYGIMSLWDNPFFGHSLIEAAALIGKTPEDLKVDPLTNIRGAAAWLRKLYDETHKPPGTTDADVESWRYAIQKYCGIPEPDLSAQHVLKVYTFMSQGYHQFGIEWDAHAVNLEPIRAETLAIINQERARRAALSAAPPNPSLSSSSQLQPHPAAPEPAATPARSLANSESRRGLWVAGLFAAIAIVLAILFRRSKQLS